MTKPRQRPAPLLARPLPPERVYPQTLKGFLSFKLADGSYLVTMDEMQQGIDERLAEMQRRRDVGEA